MAWPAFNMSGTPCSPAPASVLLNAVIQYALGRGTPEWDLVAASATLCLGNQCHGRHCDPAMNDQWRYFWVCQAHQRVLALKAQNIPGGADQAMACLGEINHGGGGGSGSGPALSPEARAALKKLRRQLIAAFKAQQR